MAITPLRFDTCTGARRSVLVPSPSWPNSFQPQAQTVPSFLSAKLWNEPPAMAVILLRF